MVRKFRTFDYYDELTHTAAHFEALATGPKFLGRDYFTADEAARAAEVMSPRERTFRRSARFWGRCAVRMVKCGDYAHDNYTEEQAVSDTVRAAHHAGEALRLAEERAALRRAALKVVRRWERGLKGTRTA